MSTRFEKWDKSEKVCMNCAISKTCKFAECAIRMFKAKCELEDVDMNERYSVNVGIDFNCVYFMVKNGADHRRPGKGE